MAEYYSLEEVARRLGKSEEQVREMVSNGELRAFRDAGSFKFRKADIDTLAPAGAAGTEEETVPVKAEQEAQAEPARDELLFLIDEEEGSADPDDLTLIGEGEEGAALATEEPGEMFSEEIGLAGEQEVDDEALTAVMETPGAGAAAPAEAPTVDLFAEAQAEMGAEAEPAAAEEAVLPFAPAAVRRRWAEAVEERSPVMSVLLVLAFLALLWTGVVIYNSFLAGPKPILDWLTGG